MKTSIVVAVTMVMTVGLVCGEAEAQLRTGTYRVDRAMDGVTSKPYHGIVAVVRTGSVYETHRSTNRGVAHGIGMVHKASAWIGTGGAAGAIVFHRGTRGTVRGSFTIAQHPGRIGRFTGRSHATVRGRYAVHGTGPDGRRFTGSISTARDQSYTRVTLMIAGKIRTGLGTSSGGVVGAGFGSHVWIYAIKGRTLVGGRYIMSNPSGPGDTEILRPVTFSATQQLRSLAEATCRCQKGRCAEAALREFGRFYRKFKTMKVGKTDYATIKDLSAKITTCLMKIGISGQRVMALVKGQTSSSSAKANRPSSASAGINVIQRDACRCTTKDCGYRMLEEFRRWLAPRAKIRVSDTESKRLAAVSKTITGCLMKAGVTAGDIMDAVRDATNG